MGNRRMLEHLGISHNEEQLYRFFLRNPKLGPNEAVSELDIRSDEVEYALGGLVHHGLVRSNNDAQVVAVDPAVAVEKLIETRLGILNDQLRAVSGARSLIPSLFEDQQFGQMNAIDADVERIAGIDQTRARLDDLAFFTHRQVLALQPDGPLSPSYIESARPLDLRCLRRGVEMRTIILRDALEDPPTAIYIRELVVHGTQIRTVDRAMERMLIYDQSVAVVPLDPENSSRGAVIIRQPGLVANMVELFERIWSDARVPDFGGASEDDAEPNEVEKQVLTMLAHTSKDEIAAREMGMSVRTFRRHVADLMLRLGASNRFQAALLATSHGWI